MTYLQIQEHIAQLGPLEEFGFFESPGLSFYCHPVQIGLMAPNRADIVSGYDLWRELKKWPNDIKKLVYGFGKDDIEELKQKLQELNCKSRWTDFQLILWGDLLNQEAIQPTGTQVKLLKYSEGKWEEEKVFLSQLFYAYRVTPMKADKELIGKVFNNKNNAEALEAVCYHC